MSSCPAWSEGWRQPDGGAAGAASPAVRIGLVPPEDVVTALVEHAPGDEFVHVLTRLEGRVELDERLGPQQATAELGVDSRGDAGGQHPDEAADIARVVIDHASPELEYVHLGSAPVELTAHACSTVDGVKPVDGPVEQLFLPWRPPRSCEARRLAG